MAELAAELGCVYDSCVDYDSYDDETPYYAWRSACPQPSMPDSARTDGRWPSARCAVT